MSVSRGKFLRELGKSIPGMVLGGGIGAAAQQLLGKIAAASGEREIASPASLRERVKEKRVEFLKSGPTTGNRLALTFDDGPTPGVTEPILDELKRRNLHATFFMIGQRIAAGPDLARRVLAEGHEVANHTFTHPKLTTLADQAVEAEIQRTQDIIEKQLRHKATWLRPPYGALRPNQAGIAGKLGLRVVLWSVDPGDWAQPGEDEIVQAVLARADSGAIIVCHDSHQQTARAVGPMLDGLLARELRPVTLSTLFG